MISSSRHHARFDGFAEAHVVSDEEVDPWHLDRPHNGVKLVIFDVNARTKRSLDVAHVSRGRRSPTDCIEKCVQPVGRIEARGFG